MCVCVCVCVRGKDVIKEAVIIQYNYNIPGSESLSKQFLEGFS